jgi:general secretion pathway protein K
MSLRRQRGSIFIVSLAVMAGLVVLMSALTVSHRESVRALTNRTQEIRARMMAEGALQRALAEIQQIQPGPSTAADDWASDGQGGSIQFLCGQDSFRFQILDASGRLNINSATEAQLKRMPFTAEQVASLLDWRDTNKTPRTDGAKDDYYGGLTNPYLTKMQTFDSVPELLLVRGFTPKALYTPGSSSGTLNDANPVGYDGPLADLLSTDSQSEDVNVQGQPKLDVRGASVDQLISFGVPSALAQNIVQSESSFQTLNDLFNVSGMTIDAAHALADNVAIGAPAVHNGLININTAPAATLAALPTIDADVAASIVDRQSTGFKSIGDLLDVPGVTLNIFSQVADSVCVSSRSFVVRALGTSGSANVALETTLVLGDDGQVRMTRLEPVPDFQAFDRWGWSQQPTTQQSIGGGS